jgi:hypothetical protein
VQQLEQEGHFPHAHYAFDHGVLSLELSRGIEHAGKHWVSELECSRHIQWQGQWQRVETMAKRCGRRIRKVFAVRRAVAMGRRSCLVFTKVVAQRWARVWSSCTNRRTSGIPRFSRRMRCMGKGRVIETRVIAGPEIFHEFGKQVTG